jgi:ribosome-associated protein
VKKASSKKAASRKAPAKAKATAAPATKSGRKKSSAARKAPAAKSAVPTKGAVAGKAGSRKAARRKPAAESPSRQALEMIARVLDEDQADEVAVIDLAGKSAMADYMVIASGRNPRHIGAMAQHLRERIKASSGRAPPIEGLATADWVLVDQGDVVVHLFRPEVRRLYNLEKMWSAALGPERDGADPRQPG